MNYDHLNTVFEYWRKDILPYLSNRFTVESFQEYLKRFSFCPSGKWLRDMEKVKFNRLGFAIEIEKFVKKYKDFCVTYNVTTKPEEGAQRMIYQLSPTFHVELVLWAWIENKELQKYGTIFTCYNEEQAFIDFVDELYKKMRKTGNTENNENPGFAGIFDDISRKNMK
ncbi:MAG TPA: hypothetical protein PLC59_08100 [Bacteroidales bacterium]|jgi:hypothetical protein|nr:hypothetical protein [Bacteroidales bacterium]